MSDDRPKSLFMTVLMTPDLANFSGAVHGGALQIEAEVEQKLFDAGKMRREMRREMEIRNQSVHVGGDALDSIRTNVGV